jgi:hypothetical protein
MVDSRISSKQLLPNNLRMAIVSGPFEKEMLPGLAARSIVELAFKGAAGFSNGPTAISSDAPISSASFSTKMRSTIAPLSDDHILKLPAVVTA